MKSINNNVTSYKSWDELIYKKGRKDFPLILFNNFFEISPEEWPRAISDAWIIPEWPGQVAPAYGWITLFEYCGYIVDEERVERADDLPELLTLYRGAIPKYRRGLAWTSDIKKAKFFANRFNSTSDKQGVVWKVTVPRELVLARFTDRNESDIY